MTRPGGRHEGAIAEAFEPMDGLAREAIRRRLESAVARERGVRRARRIASFCLATLLSGLPFSAGAVYAAANALPGDPFFGTKLAIEEVRISAAPTDRIRRAFAEQAALARIGETDAIRRLGAEEDELDEAAGRFGIAARRALGEADRARMRGRAEERLRRDVRETEGSARERLEKELEDAIRDASRPKNAGAGARGRGGGWKDGENGRDKAKGGSGQGVDRKTEGPAGGVSGDGDGEDGRGRDTGGRPRTGR